MAEISPNQEFFNKLVGKSANVDETLLHNVSLTVEKIKNFLKLSSKQLLDKSTQDNFTDLEKIILGKQKNTGISKILKSGREKLKEIKNILTKSKSDKPTVDSILSTLGLSESLMNILHRNIKIKSDKIIIKLNKVIPSDLDKVKKEYALAEKKYGPNIFKSTFGKMSDWFKDSANDINQILDYTSTKVISVFKWMKDVVMNPLDALVDLVGVMAEIGFEAVRTVFTVLAWPVNKAMNFLCKAIKKFLFNPLIFLPLTIVLGIFGFQIFKIVSPFISKLIDYVWDKISGYVLNFINTLMDSWLAKWLAENTQPVLDFVKSIFSKETAENIKEILKEWFGMDIDAFNTKVRNVIDIIKKIDFKNNTLWDLTWTAIVKVAYSAQQGIWSWIVDNAKKMMENIGINKLIQDFTNQIYSLISIFKLSLETFIGETEDVFLQLENVPSELMESFFDEKFNETDEKLKEELSLMTQDMENSANASIRSAETLIEQQVEDNVSPERRNLEKRIKGNEAYLEMSRKLKEEKGTPTVETLERIELESKSAVSIPGMSVDIPENTKTNILLSDNTPMSIDYGKLPDIPELPKTVLELQVVGAGTEDIVKHIYSTAPQYKTMFELIEYGDTLSKLEAVPESQRSQTAIEDYKRRIEQSNSYLISLNIPGIEGVKYDVFDPSMISKTNEGFVVNNNWSKDRIFMSLLQHELRSKSSPSPDIPQAEWGGIITSPSLAIIGEGMVSEVIIPLNSFGINFITESINEVIKRNEISKPSQTKEKNDPIVRRYKSSKGGIDKTLYDMKLFSTSVIGN